MKFWYFLPKVKDNMKILNNIFLVLDSIFFSIIAIDILASLPTNMFSLTLLIVFALSIFVHYMFRRMKPSKLYRISLIVNCVSITTLIIFIISMNIFDLHYLGLETLGWLVSIFYVYCLGLLLGLFEVISKYIRKS